MTAEILSNGEETQLHKPNLLTQRLIELGIIVAPGATVNMMRDAEERRGRFIHQEVGDIYTVETDPER